MTIIVSISAIAGRRLVLQRPSPSFAAGAVSLVATICVGDHTVRTLPQPVSEDPVLGLTVTFRDALTVEVPDAGSVMRSQQQQSSSTGSRMSAVAIDSMTCEFSVVPTRESTGVAAIALSKRWMRLEPLGGEALVSFSICRVANSVVIPRNISMINNVVSSSSFPNSAASSLLNANNQHPESWAALHRANVEDTERAVSSYATARELHVRVVSVEGLSLPIANSAKVRWYGTFSMVNSPPSATVVTSAHYHPVAGSNAETSFFHKAVWPLAQGNRINNTNNNNNNESSSSNSNSPKQQLGPSGRSRSPSPAAAVGASRALSTTDGSTVTSSRIANNANNIAAGVGAGQNNNNKNSNNNNNSGADGPLVAVFQVQPNNCGSELTVHVEVVSDNNCNINSGGAGSPAVVFASPNEPSHHDAFSPLSPAAAANNAALPGATATTTSVTALEAAKASCDVAELLQSRGETTERRDLHFANSAQHRFSIVTVELRVVPVEVPSPFLGLPARDRVTSSTVLARQQLLAAQHNQALSFPSQPFFSSDQQQFCSESVLPFSAASPQSRRQSVALPAPPLSYNQQQHSSSALSLTSPTSSSKALQQQQMMMMMPSSTRSSGRSRSNPSPSSQPSFHALPDAAPAFPGSTSNNNNNNLINNNMAHHQFSCANTAGANTSSGGAGGGAVSIKCFESLTLATQVRIEESITAAVESAMGRVMRRFEDVLNKVAAVEERVGQLVHQHQASSSSLSPAAFSAPMPMLVVPPSPTVHPVGSSAAAGGVVVVVDSGRSGGIALRPTLSGGQGSSSSNESSSHTLNNTLGSAGNNQNQEGARRHSRRGSVVFGQWTMSDGASGIFSGV